MSSEQMTKVKKGDCCHVVPTKNAQVAPHRGQGGGTSENETAIPMVDIIETDQDFLIIADMPGVLTESVDLQFSAGELTITGEVEREEGEEEMTCRCHQFIPKNYFRVFRIGETIDGEKISADFENGVLTIKLPKRAEIQPKKIAIQKK